MRVFGNSDMRLVIILLATAFLVTWMLPIGLLFAQGDEEEELLEELTGEEATEEEGSIEVLGFTDENAFVMNNRFLITIIVLVVAALGGLFLSFAIRGRT